MFQNIERISRSILWLALAFMLVAVPIGMAKSDKSNAALQTELKKAEMKIVELSKPQPKGPTRFSWKKSPIDSRVCTGLV